MEKNGIILYDSFFFFHLQVKKKSNVDGRLVPKHHFFFPAINRKIRPEYGSTKLSSGSCSFMQFKTKMHTQEKKPFPSISFGKLKSIRSRRQTEVASWFRAPERPKKKTKNQQKQHPNRFGRQMEAFKKNYFFKKIEALEIKPSTNDGRRCSDSSLQPRNPTWIFYAKQWRSSSITIASIWWLMERRWRRSLSRSLIWWNEGSGGMGKKDF